MSWILSTTKEIDSIICKGLALFFSLGVTCFPFLTWRQTTMNPGSSPPGLPRSLHRPNGVTPFGMFEATPERGSLMGNRGCIHDN